jgi:ATP-dependent helicase/nuclease subunit A
MLLDEAARLEAVKVNGSYIVQAPAGSGKTSLLVQRFINLLAICNQPEECLAITFTKKAAFEMRSRVLEQLQQPEISHKLKILTIDSFCAGLVEKMPLLSKLGINLKIAEYPEELYIAAIEQLFKSQSKYLINLFSYLENDHVFIKKLLINMLSNREQWLPLIVPMKELAAKEHDLNLKSILENNLIRAIEDLLKDILLYLPDISIQNKIINIAKQAANNLKNINKNNNIIFCEKLINSWPTANIADLSIWQGLVELLFNQDGSVRRAVNINQGFLSLNSFKHQEDKLKSKALKTEMVELLQYLAANEQTFLEKLQQINIIPDVVFALDNWDFLESLFYILPELVAHLLVVFQDQQQVDFTQVALTALTGLGSIEEPTELGLILDSTVKHILVDEFQDTSLLQFNLLEKLITNWHENDYKTIFLVGDPMQSIYRFRQADVGLFLKVQQYGLGNVKLKNLYLTTNFRSTSTIVNNLNKLFTNIFPKKSNIALGGVVYNIAHANNNESSEVKFFVTENSQSQANSIISLIKQLKQKQPSDHSIAILVRSRMHAKIIMQEFRDNNIKFQANELELLADQMFIADLIVLTKSILHINDLVSWFALLRSPLVGLLLTDIHALVEGIEEPLFKQLQNYKNNKLLSQDAKLRLSVVLPILFDAIKQKETELNFAKLIKKTWIKLGGDLLLQGQSMDLIEEFFQKILCENKINFDINLKNFFVSQNKETTDLTKVQLMTIHKAKGLEFDTVIVPSLDKKIVSSRSKLLIWDPKYLLFGIIKSNIYNFIDYFEKQRELYEEQRLLYVAMSRAKQNFYGFSLNSKANNQSFFKLLEPYIEVDERYLSVLSHNEPIKDKIAKKLILYRLPSDWYKNYGSKY